MNKYIKISIFWIYSLIFCMLIALVVYFVGNHNITHYGFYLNDECSYSADKIMLPIVGIVMLYVGSLPLLASVLRLTNPSIPFYERGHSLLWKIFAVLGTTTYVLSFLVALFVSYKWVSTCITGYYFAIEHQANDDFCTYYNDYDLELILMVVSLVFPCIYAFLRRKHIYAVFH